MKPPKQSKYPDKLGKKTLQKEQIEFAKVLTPFEEIIHLAGICNLNLGGRKGIGALILKKVNLFRLNFVLIV